MANAGTFRIQLLTSGIGFDKTQKDTLRGLGLRKRHQVVERKDTPAARGMVYKVRHLVKVLGPTETVAKTVAWKGAIVVPGTGPAAKVKKAPAEAKGAGASDKKSAKKSK